MPLAYGLIRTGTLVISQGVETMDVERNPITSVVDNPNKPANPATGNTGNNTGIGDLNRYRDKSGRLYPWLEEGDY